MIKLPFREQLPLKLREIYEKYGYKQYRMDKFEPYDMYRENKNFLKNEGIITFTDPSGRLMALKPDVTMSIIKNSADSDATRKLYYNENVFRLLPGRNEFCEINQMGLEFIGGDNSYAQAEVILLAMRSLEAINEEYRLNVAHMGYIAALMDFAGIQNGDRAECIALMRQKNLHGLGEFMQKTGVDPDKAEAVRAVMSVTGSIKKAVGKLSDYVFSDAMQAAVSELQDLTDTLSFTGCDGKLQLDFSVINDPDYYNGIVFQGYLPNIPRAVLSGGRYDNLMRRFGKQRNAIGFALYLGELERFFSEPEEYDADLLLIYGNMPAKIALKVVEMLKPEYKNIRAERSIPEGIRARKIMNISEVGDIRHA
ncbi:MAG TPA: ATP phosphoribosyltransferase regulatory subunit [Bacillota bacterium]|nr:ATP phosphoribosyltransferase regulatory subunit [Bacillota bacterium]HOK69217.1 ATP phosphoribosyltransferase regulatory subunit [Bacillota bacterium]HPP84670.1 ATP phosphoribosyltransferase regulatory subunit [Bacillota bacterium]